jgi:hypothetical protein
VGWISRNNLDPPVKAELFFLTSLFIELIEPVTKGFECNGDITTVDEAGK